MRMFDSPDFYDYAIYGYSGKGQEDLCLRVDLRSINEIDPKIRSLDDIFADKGAANEFEAYDMLADVDWLERCAYDPYFSDPMFANKTTGLTKEVRSKKALSDIFRFARRHKDKFRPLDILDRYEYLDLDTAFDALRQLVADGKLVRSGSGWSASYYYAAKSLGDSKYPTIREAAEAALREFMDGRKEEFSKKEFMDEYPQFERGTVNCAFLALRAKGMLDMVGACKYAHYRAVPTNCERSPFDEVPAIKEACKGASSSPRAQVPAMNASEPTRAD